MENYFYVDNNQQQAGPITPERFAAFGVTAETLVWRKGLSEWTPAKELEELAPYFQNTSETSGAQPAAVMQSSGETIVVQSVASQPVSAQSVPHVAAAPAMQQPVQPSGYAACSQPSASPIDTSANIATYIPTRLWLAVLSVVFMCQPLGIFAIHHAAKVNFNVLQGKNHEAMRHSNLALRWSLFALTVSLLWLFFLISTFGGTILAYFADNYEFAF